MKALKVIFTILLTIVLIIISLASEVLTIVNLTVINPAFYKNTLRQMGIYEDIYDVMIVQVKNVISINDSIPDNYKDEANEILTNAITKNDFEKQVGNLLGDTVNFFLYGKGEGDLPIQEWVDNLTEEIDNSDMAAEIPGMKAILDSTIKSYFESFNFSSDESIKISDVFYSIFTPNEKTRIKMDEQLNLIRNWVRWSHIILYIGIAIILIIIGLLFVIWHKNVGVVFRLCGILLLFTSIGYILSGTGMFASITIASVLDKIPSQYLEYTAMAQSAINPLALYTLLAGITMLIISIVLIVIGSAIFKKAKSGDIITIDVNNQIIPQSSIPEQVEQSAPSTEELFENKEEETKKE